MQNILWHIITLNILTDILILVRKKLLKITIKIKLEKRRLIIVKKINKAKIIEFNMILIIRKLNICFMPKMFLIFDYI